MAILSWLSRCVPGLSLITLLIFIEYTLGIVRTSYFSFFHPTLVRPITGNPILLWTFAAYSVFLHLLSWFFPLRLCWAAWSAGTGVIEAHKEHSDKLTRVQSFQDDISIESLDLSELEKCVSDHVQAIMAIIVPSYKEDIATLEDTLNVLASHAMAKETYDIYLAMEERDPKAAQTAQSLIKSFDGRFLSMKFTMHPAGIEGEAPGKSSNVSWAAREVERVYAGRPEWRNVLVTTMDSDTHLLPQYFEHLRAAHQRNRKSGYITDMTLYMPPIVFDRNAHTVPMLVRVADLMWSGAGLSCYQPEPTLSGVGIPTAVYTLPLALVHLANGWDTGPTAIGEDLHMMLKCYFATNGRMKIQSIPSPASQCNITTEVRGIRGWLSNHSARYNQGLRHMWGCLDTGFAIRQWCGMGNVELQEPSPRNGPCEANQNRRRKLSHTELSLKLSQYALHGSEPRRFTLRNLVVFSRLFEAHFLPAHLFVILIASTFYTQSIRNSADHYWLCFFLDLTGYIRAMGYATMILYFFVFYERYHEACVQAREREMHKAGLYSQLADQFSHRGRWNLAGWPDYFVFPVAGTMFGSFCLFQAALSHLFTDRLVYLVSAKPVRSLLPGKTNDDEKTRSVDTEASRDI